MKNRLKDLRKEKKLTVRELEEKVNIVYSTISRLENGVVPFNEDYLQIFSKFFNVSYDYLMGLTDIRQSITPDTNVLQSTFINKMLALSDKEQADIVKLIDKIQRTPNKTEINTLLDRLTKSPLHKEIYEKISLLSNDDLLFIKRILDTLNQDDEKKTAIG